MDLLCFVQFFTLVFVCTLVIQQGPFPYFVFLFIVKHLPITTITATYIANVCNTITFLPYLKERCNAT